MNKILRTVLISLVVLVITTVVAIADSTAWQRAAVFTDVGGRADPTTEQRTTAFLDAIIADVNDANVASVTVPHGTDMMAFRFAQSNADSNGDGDQYKFDLYAQANEDTIVARFAVLTSIVGTQYLADCNDAGSPWYQGDPNDPNEIHTADYLSLGNEVWWQPDATSGTNDTPWVDKNGLGITADRIAWYFGPTVGMDKIYFVADSGTWTDANDLNVYIDYMAWHSRYIGK